MIITCPSCATRYNLDPGTLGDRGRLVRCSHCGRRWHQEPPADMPVRVDTPPEQEEFPSFSFAADGPTETAAADFRHRPEARQGSDAWLGWVGLLSAVVLVLAGAYFARDVVVGLWPPAARLYELARVPVEVSATERSSLLTFRNVEPSRIVEDGETFLVVSGEIVDASTEVAEVSEVRVVLRGGQQEELASWTFQPPEVRLVPNEIVPFETRFADPPPGTEGLSLYFE